MLIRDQLIKIYLFYTPVSLSNTVAGEFNKQKQLEMIIEYLTLQYIAICKAEGFTTNLIKKFICLHAR